MEDTPEVVEDEVETRVDESAISAFQDIGYEGRLPDDLAKVYNNFKRAKDSISPGRLTAEGYATVVTLYKLIA